MGMRRSRGTLFFTLMVALTASFALPVTASAGGSFDRDCEDFSSQAEAQDALDSGLGDRERLDGDDDGTACQTFDYGESDETFEEIGFADDASVDEYPREGIASGGGSTASGGLSPLPLVLSAGAFALLAVGSGGFALRRRLGHEDGRGPTG